MGVIERWWMLRYPSGVVRLAQAQGDDETNDREDEARAVGARLFKVVRAEDHAGAVDAERERCAEIIRRQLQIWVSGGTHETLKDVLDRITGGQ